VRTSSQRQRRAIVVTIVVLLVAGTLAGCAPPPSRPGFSGTTCWEKRAYYQARNPGLKETLGSGTIHSYPCVLSAYLAIERAAIEFGVPQYTDALIRIAACESLLQPTIVGRRDAADVGLFQWNDKPPRYWWSTARNLFNAWQRAKAWASLGRYVPRYATYDRLDPYNAARVAAWEIVAFPHSWGATWLCKGFYDPAAGRIR
jgi:hypothetical protein